jgi:hypothetical protein
LASWAAGPGSSGRRRPGVFYADGQTQTARRFSSEADQDLPSKSFQARPSVLLRCNRAARPPPRPSPRSMARGGRAGRWRRRAGRALPTTGPSSESADSDTSRRPGKIWGCNLQRACGGPAGPAPRPLWHAVRRGERSGACTGAARPMRCVRARVGAARPVGLCLRVPENMFDPSQSESIIQCGATTTNHSIRIQRPMTSKDSRRWAVSEMQ